MVGELPEDFLRVPVDVAQAQVMADERVARLVQAQQQGGFVAIPANTVGRLTITVAQVKYMYIGFSTQSSLTFFNKYCKHEIKSNC